MAKTPKTKRESKSARSAGTKTTPTSKALAGGGTGKQKSKVGTGPAPLPNVPVSPGGQPAAAGTISAARAPTGARIDVAPATGTATPVLAVPVGITPGLPVHLRGDARNVTAHGPATSYTVMISGGDSGVVQDGSLAALASNLPYIGVRLGVQGMVIDEATPDIRVINVYFVFRDDLAGRIEAQGARSSTNLYVGQASGLLGDLHRILQTETPITVRLGVWFDDTDYEFTQCDIYASAQTIGQRED